MIIRMLTGAPGSIDGFRVATYEADQEYDLTATVGARELAAAFVAAGLAEEAGAKTASAAEAEQTVEGDAQAQALEVDAGSPPAKPGRKPKAQ